ncbi:MAG: DASS family sodium-coupled anion symporter [Candidatus Marinimicrobia bacterium]|nr:DASS family sodium-coupled anion symporter [Candidatus Neomarinimicrobiota bacterium]MCF7828537.1 DASS family sodium-coupled anion symporter [Candidatus Neomarinimicrobiota bacterium]MCF7882040.1 DASS family sodium-coupled anion symporter [Candidatus Neomarinimicrobiota bacterium]
MFDSVNLPNLNWRNIVLVGGPVLSVLFILIFDLEPGRPEVTYTAAIALLMALWWITEVINLGVTALLPLVLFPLFHIMPGKEVAPVYFNNVILLFMGAFIVALAMEKWELHRRLGLRILALLGNSGPGIIFGFMVTTAFLSMWISNTATAMIMVPIALAVISKLEDDIGSDNIHGFTIALLLAIAYAASIGGTATIIGTPPNLAFIKIYNIYYPDAEIISFSQWMVFALPVAVVFLLIAWGVILGLSGVFKQKINLDREYFRGEYRRLGPVAYEEKVVMVVFSLMALLWITRAELQIGSVTIPGWSNLFPDPSFIDDSTIAIAMAFVLFLIPAKSEESGRIMHWRDARNLPWSIILLFGGGFALAEGMKVSGLSEWIGSHLHGLANVSPVIIILTVAILVVFLTELTSNTATTQMILPILAAVAGATGIAPLLLMIPATLAASYAFMLPVATPPNAVVFGSRRLKVYEMARVGLLMNFLGVGLILLAVFFLGSAIFQI